MFLNNSDAQIAAGYGSGQGCRSLLKQANNYGAWDAPADVPILLESEPGFSSEAAACFSHDKQKMLMRRYASASR
jgi:hypothetical protein